VLHAPAALQRLLDRLSSCFDYVRRACPSYCDCAIGLDRVRVRDCLLYGGVRSCQYHCNGVDARSYQPGYLARARMTTKLSGRGPTVARQTIAMLFIAFPIQMGASSRRAVVTLHCFGERGVKRAYSGNQATASRATTASMRNLHRSSQSRRRSSSLPASRAAQGATPPYWLRCNADPRSRRRTAYRRDTLPSGSPSSRCEELSVVKTFGTNCEIDRRIWRIC
jgi:hypothetical protein